MHSPTKSRVLVLLVVSCFPNLLSAGPVSQLLTQARCKGLVGLLRFSDYRTVLVETTGLSVVRKVSGVNLVGRRIDLTVPKRGQRATFAEDWPFKTYYGVVLDVKYGPLGWLGGPVITLWNQGTGKIEQVRAGGNAQLKVDLAEGGGLSAEDLKNVGYDSLKKFPANVDYQKVEIGWMGLYAKTGLDPKECLGRRVFLKSEVTASLAPEPVEMESTYAWVVGFGAYREPILVDDKGKYVNARREISIDFSNSGRRLTPTEIEALRAGLVP